VINFSRVRDPFSCATVTLVPQGSPPPYITLYEWGMAKSIQDSNCYVIHTVYNASVTQYVATIPTLDNAILFSVSLDTGSRSAIGKGNIPFFGDLCPANVYLAPDPAKAGYTITMVGAGGCLSGISQTYVVNQIQSVDVFPRSVGTCPV